MYLEVAEKLRGVANTLTKSPELWCQGATTHGAAHCALGWVGVSVAKGLPRKAGSLMSCFCSACVSYSMSAINETDLCNKFLARAIGRADSSDIVCWNDERHRKVQEVIAAFNKAADLAQLKAIEAGEKLDEGGPPFEVIDTRSVAPVEPIPQSRALVCAE